MEKTEIVFVPHDVKETEFRLEKYPNFKKELEDNCSVIYDHESIPSAIQKIRQKSVDQMFARSQIYMDRYYEIQEFEKRNADDLAEVVDQILLKMGVKERTIELKHSKESDERSETNQEFRVGGVYKLFSGGAGYNTKESEQNYDLHKVSQIDGFKSRGYSTDYKELKLWIEKNKIDIEGLPKWLKPHVKHYLEGGKNTPISIEKEEEELTINKYVRTKLQDIKLSFGKLPIFKVSFNYEYSEKESSKKEHYTYIRVSAKF
ncbi:hypothetical protein [Campylobacter lanienae]|uniref:hypothetical protein n=1 Tax=Campylobacter lanienae TaxID=75658 RepID=UPI002A91679B|nr:hypothetical protein [Campylobacter lanienae]MDY5519191.1 hypothetical protein [Campylobacter lanienae]MDY6134318.1 hypothetical protein [Campylobacter lanienae]